MHANPSTASTRTYNDRKELEREFIDLYLSVSDERRFIVRALLDACSFHEIDDLITATQAETTSEAELSIIIPILDEVKNDLASARFQPTFTKQQITHAEEIAQKQRDIRRRMGLSVLCMTEKRLQHTFQHHQEAFRDMFDAIELFVADSQVQLEMANTAYHRLLLVESDEVGAQV